MKANLFLIALLWMVVLSAQSQDNCQLQYTYRVETDADKVGKIYITLQKGDPQNEYILWDIYKNKQVQKRTMSIMPNQEILIFDNVPTGNYAIVISAKGCKTPNTIGGIEGIDIK